MSEGGLMVSVSGIRGRVGEALTPEIVARYAAGFGAWARARGTSRSIVVGRDSRVSGPLFHRVVLSALESVGCDPIDIGMAPTPTVQLAVEHHHASVDGDACPHCGSEMRMAEGCSTCTNPECGWSRC